MIELLIGVIALDMWLCCLVMCMFKLCLYLFQRHIFHSCNTCINQDISVNFKLLFTIFKWTSIAQKLSKYQTIYSLGTKCGRYTLNKMLYFGFVFLMVCTCYVVRWSRWQNLWSLRVHPEVEFCLLMIKCVAFKLFT